MSSQHLGHWERGEKQGMFVQFVSLIPNVLQKIENKGGFYSLPTPIPAITFSIGGVGLTELHATAQIKPAFISMQVLIKKKKMFWGWISCLLTGVIEQWVWCPRPLWESRAFCGPIVFTVVQAHSPSSV